MKRTIWISYDLGIRGDYEGLYMWLDEHGAKECSDNLAVLSFECVADLVQDLRANLSAAVKLDKRSRIYVVHSDPESRKLKGAFLFGRRKAARWTGYAAGSQEVDEAEV